MGSYMSPGKGKTNSIALPGSMVEPEAAARARAMTAPGYFDPVIADSVAGETELQNFGRKLLGGEAFGRDPGYDTQLAGLAARGLATSAPGIMAESNNIYSRRLEGARILEQANQGLAFLRSLPEEFRAKILAMLLGQNLPVSSGSTGGGGYGISISAGSGGGSKGSGGGG